MDEVENVVPEQEVAPEVVEVAVDLETPEGEVSGEASTEEVVVSDEEVKEEPVDESVA